ncbi:hypothetical protein [Streptomyces sp. NPDC056683]|uniref:hypothetical protein n=1 Tax=Streptomyces sp. NPDC056683 TaxID=3345910 RepID=UPI00369ADF82
MLTLKVAEFSDLPDAYLWLLKQPPTFLVEALRDGIAGLGESPLANVLAAGSIGGTSSPDPDPPGFHPAQGHTYRACLGQGVHLVWGPPGTGKTTVLALRDVESGGGPLAEVGTAHRFQGREFPVVVFDTVEGTDGREPWMSLAHREPDASDWARNGVPLFNVAATRVQTRLYVLGSWKRMQAARNGRAFTHLAALVGTPGVRRLRASHLITPPQDKARDLGGFGAALADVPARHVEVTGLDDELTFFSTFEEEINKARTSI